MIRKTGTSSRFLFLVNMPLPMVNRLDAYRGRVEAENSGIKLSRNSFILEATERLLDIKEGRVRADDYKERKRDENTMQRKRMPGVELAGGVTV